MSSEDLVAYLKQRLREEEQWALAASVPYPYAVGEPKVPAGGVHWRWVAGEDWTPVKPDPVVADTVGGPDYYGSNVNLVSVEEWPSGNPHRPMPAVVANSMVEVQSGPAGHIAYWDPARVLADIEAKRRLIDLHVNDGSATLPSCAVCDVGSHSCGCVGWDEWPCETLKILVQPYSSRPDFNEDWRTPS